jgi:hypothetical protein
MLVTTTFFAIILILSAFVSSGFSVPLVSAQSTLPPTTVSDSLPPTSSNIQGNPFYDPIAGGLINQYPYSQTYPYQDPYQVPTSPTQTLPDELLSLEEQQLPQENGVVDVTAPETTISYVVDGNNAPLQEGATTTSNKIVFTIQGIDDSAVTSFQCVLDNIQQDPSICSTNPVVAENLPPGAHLFQISSVDSAGIVDATPAIFSWNVVVLDQYLGGQQMPQQLQQQQLSILPLQEQTRLPYQTNASPYMTVVPNTSNSNATIINENQQLLPSQNFQAANPIVVPPQYYTTDPSQTVDAQQYQSQQSSQNTSGLQQPPVFSSLSPFPTPLFDYSQLHQPQQQMVATAANTTNATSQFPPITNPTLPTSTDLDNENKDSQSLATDNIVESNGGENVILTDNSTHESVQSLLPTLDAIDNSTLTNASLQGTENASVSSTTGSFTVTDDRHVDFGVADGHHGVYEVKIEYTGQIILDNTPTVSSVQGTCEYNSYDNGVLNDHHTESPIGGFIAVYPDGLIFEVIDNGDQYDCGWRSYIAGGEKLPYVKENDVIRAEGSRDPPCDAGTQPGAFCTWKITWDITSPVNPDNQPPVANAGPDQTVNSGDEVILQGSGSDPDGDPITKYSWTPSDSLDDASSPSPTFVAPDVNEETTLTFLLVVSDGKADSQPDTVDITVTPNTCPAPPAPAATSTTSDVNPDSALLSLASLSTPSLPAITAVQATTPNCQPNADAGDDQQVTEENQVIRLDGSGSIPQDGSLQYLWTKKVGPDSVVINNRNSAEASFTFPTSDEFNLMDEEERKVTLQLQVSNRHGTDTDDVVIKDGCFMDDDKLLDTYSSGPWRFKYGIVEKRGLVLEDITAGKERLFESISVPHFKVQDIAGNPKIVRFCDPDDQIPTYFDKLEPPKPERNGIANLKWRFTVDIGKNEDDALKGRLKIVYDVAIITKGVRNCELSKFECYRLVPKVTYSWIPAPSTLRTFSAFYKLDYGPNTALSQVRDLDTHGVPGVFGQQPMTTHEAGFVAVTNGEAGRYDNIHTAHPGQGIFIPGCRYLSQFDCVHMHWRWSKVPASTDPMVEPSTGLPLKGVRGTPNLVPDQTIAIAMVKDNPGEEDPDDPSILLTREQIATASDRGGNVCATCYLISGGDPVVWYVTSVQNKATDTFFRHGIFVLDTSKFPGSKDGQLPAGPQTHSGH